SCWAIREFETAAPAADSSFQLSAETGILVQRPLAILHVADLDPIPVFERISRVNLQRGAGWISGTAKPGEVGNGGIAGHRDGFFGGLKDVSIGDAMDLYTTTSIRRYRVEQVEIVEPDNVSVLKPRQAPSITLVTCYPFYFVGNAPLRFIVHGALSETVDSRP